MDEDDFDPDAGHHGDAHDSAQADPMEEEEKVDISNKEAVLFIVDVREPMLTNKLGNASFAFNALECAANCMADRVVSADSDLLGILLVGTKNSPQDGYHFNNQTVLNALAEPRAIRIRDLRNRIGEAVELEINTRFEDFGGPMEGDFSVASALHHAQLLLNVKETKGVTKRVLWFTCSDHADDAGKSEAVVKARDMFEQGITIQPFFFQPQAAAPLDLAAFWQEVVAANRAQPVTTASRAEPQAAGAADLAVFDSSSASAVQTLVRRSAARRLARKKVELSLPSGQKLGLAFVGLVQKKALPSARTVEETTNELVTASSSLVCKVSATLLHPEHQVGQLYLIGGTIATFEPGERSKLCDFGEHGVRCLGFFPAAELQPYHCIAPAIFATPSNDVVAGSTTACRALIEQMAAKGVAMLACWVSGSQPRMLALTAQLEVRGAAGTVELPYGFNVSRLPFGADFRHVDPPAFRAEPTAEQVDAAKDLIRAVGIAPQYTPRPNPALANYYAKVEAGALNEPAPEITDLTLPDESAIRERAAAEIERFRNEVYGEDYDPEGGVGSKRKKAPKAAQPETAEEWRTLAAAPGGLDSLTNDALKGYCETHKLKKGGKKSDLVARVAEHIAGAGDAADELNEQ